MARRASPLGPWNTRGDLVITSDVTVQRMFVVLGAIALVMIALTGCGSSSSPNTAQRTDTTPTTPTTPDHTHDHDARDADARAVRHQAR